MILHNWLALLRTISPLKRAARSHATVLAPCTPSSARIECLEARQVLTAIDLANLGSAGTTIFGAVQFNNSGYSVSDAGDMNGDGFDDLIVGTPRAAGAGETYVIYGSNPMPTTFDLANLGAAGIKISGVDNANGGDHSGCSVSSAGDVNGDGFDDILIGAFLADSLGNSSVNAGESYLVFGSDALPQAIELSSLGSMGVTFFGAAADERSGQSVSGAGDINGDGFDDIVIGAPYGGSSRGYKGSSYLVFGRASLPESILLGSFSASFSMTRITRLDASDALGSSVSGAGDVNGDGYDDLLIGARTGSSLDGERFTSGYTYVILGRSDLPHLITLDIDDGINPVLRGADISIVGADAFDWSGWSVSGAGDVNGDGFDDLLIGAPLADAANNNKIDAGESYLIFGRAVPTAVIDLASLGSSGIRIFGAHAGDYSGFSVSGAGDMNGDGFDDLLIGAAHADELNESKIDIGKSYIVFGGSSLAAAIDLGTLAASGITMSGGDAGGYAGRSVSGAGDVNGDGFGDVILGAKNGDGVNGTRPESGESYLIFGGNSFTNSVTHAGTVAADILTGSNAANRMNGGAGNDTLVGNGGMDVIYGGQGDDVLTIADVTFLRIEGGNGSDTLRLDNAGLLLNLTTLADNRLTSIETIDLRGSGANTLTLNALEVLNLTSNSNAAHTTNTLMVRRNADDTINTGAGWTQTIRTTVNGVVYNTFESGAARLLLEVPPIIVDLSNPGSAGMTIFGADIEDRSGISVGNAGDVNGDGFDDLLIGASLADATGNSRREAGECYVVFGGPMLPSTLDLANLGSAGITIFGAGTFDFTGNCVSGAGDINGDGFDDLLVGSHHSGVAGDLLKGKCYVIFGGVSLPSTLDLSNPVSAGVTISDAGNGDFIGTSVSGAGDVNGDGFDDIIVGDFGAYQAGSGVFATGVSYVIFGAASLPATLTVDSLGAAGVTIFGVDFGDASGRSVSNAGDVNGDGFDDLLVGAERADASPNAKTNAGESYVIFGRASFPTVLNLGNLGSGGLTIYGADSEDRSGYSVSNAGDVNGDGFDDILIGAYRDDGHATLNADKSYLIFGGATLPAAIDLFAPGAAGITILGVDAGDHSGRSVSNAGDVNGDGYDDLLIGAHDAAAAGNSKPSAGEAYVVFGSPSLPSIVDLADLNGFGIAILGADMNDRLGMSASSAGDVDGDGFDDLIIGAPTAYASGNSKIQAGESYVIFGRDFTAAVTHAGGAASQPLTGNSEANVMIGGRGRDTLLGNGGADVIYGGEGNDTIAITDTAFLRLDGGNGSDALRLDGAGINLNLGAVSDNKLTSIEMIDIRGSGINSLTLGVRDVLNMTSGSNTSHAANTLTIRLDRDDVLSVGSGWVSSPNITIGESTYRTLTQGGATLRVEIPPPIYTDLWYGRLRVFLVEDIPVNIAITQDLSTAEILISSSTVSAGTHVLRVPIAPVTVGIQVGLSRWNDRFDGSSAGLSVTVGGGDGNDSIVGGVGHDVLEGGRGSDTLTGGAGFDTLQGGADTEFGLDLLLESFNADITLTASQMIVASGGHTDFDSVSGFERVMLLGGSGANRIDASLCEVPTSLYGGSGNDVLTGGRRDDLVDGQGGDDTAGGGLGRDTLIGGPGASDVLFEIADFDISLGVSEVYRGGETAQLVGIEKAMFWGNGGPNRLDATNSSIPVTLFGGGGNDTLTGSSQADGLDGQAGNDLLIGGAGTDSFVGGAGNDTLVEAADQNLTLTNSTLLMSGNSQPDVSQKFSTIEFADLSGGVGRNRIDVSGFTLGLGTTINGGGQSDTIIGSPAPDTINTLTGHDLINGLGGADVVNGGGGNDTITGGDGSDNLNGQVGNDLVDGGADADVIVGGNGIDTLNGGGGNDFLNGQADSGVISGGEGNDILQGGSANETLNGESGEDRIFGGFGDDLMLGGTGADSLYGNLGEDTLMGGDGDDDLRGEGYRDTIDGGAGIDRTAEYMQFEFFTITAQQFGHNTLDRDTYLNMERINLFGTPVADLIDARQATASVLLNGGTGNDTLLGGARTDVLNGGPGNDMLSGGGGNDVFEGDTGFDTIVERADANFTVNGTTISSALTGTEAPRNIEMVVLVGGVGANKLDASLATKPVILIGGPGNDTLLGGSAVDTLSGGNRGDSTVPGSDGTDSLDGGGGADFYDADSADTLVSDGSDATLADAFTRIPTWIDQV